MSRESDRSEGLLVRLGGQQVSRGDNGGVEGGERERGPGESLEWKRRDWVYLKKGIGENWERQEGNHRKVYWNRR